MGLKVDMPVTLDTGYLPANKFELSGFFISELVTYGIDDDRRTATQMVPQ